MVAIILIFSFFVILALILIVKNKISESKQKDNIDENSRNRFYVERNETKYQSKQLVSNSEKYFLDIIDNNFGDNYRIIPQVPLSSIINKHKEFENQYQNELYRTIDIGIFDKNTFEPLLMIEINDKTHKQYNRYKRDLKVKEILQTANIPLITFYTDMPNRPDYIIDRINKNLM